MAWDQAVLRRDAVFPLEMGLFGPQATLKTGTMLVGI